MSNTMDICLVSPPSCAVSTFVPIALMGLAAWLEERNIRSEIIDIKRDQFRKLTRQDKQQITGEIVQHLARASPLYVGLTAYTSDFWDVIELAVEIKKSTPAKVVVGGIHAMIQPRDFLFEGSPVDVVVVGEGEETLTDLIETDSCGGMLDNMRGILFRRGKQIIQNEGRPQFSDLSALPMPAYHKVDMRYYLQPNRTLLRLLVLSGVHIMTSRGCPYQCTFCSNRNRRVRYRPIEKVIEELHYLKENYGLESFYIQDDTFSIKKDRVYQFLNEMKSRKLELIWGAETRVNLVDRQMLKAMRQSGCLQLDFGVESGSQAALDRMKKQITVEQIQETFQACRELGIRTFANYMFNTPGETEEDVELTFKMMKSLRAAVGAVMLCTPLPGSKIYEDYVKPALTIEEYQIYTDPSLFSAIVDPRFRMAAHNIDPLTLFLKGGIATRGWQSFIDLTSQREYWQTLLRSRRKLNYLRVFGRMVIRQVRTYARYALRWFSTRHTSAKLHLGCFDYVLPGWMNTDITPHIFVSRVPGLAFALFKAGLISQERYEQHKQGVFRSVSYLNVTKRFPYADERFDYVYSSHLLEHLYPHQTFFALCEIHRILKKTGIVRVAVPDLDKIVANYDSQHPEEFLEGIFEAKQKRDKNKHHWHYNEFSLTKLLSEAGFREIYRYQFREGRCADVTLIDNRPESLFMEGVK